MKQAHVEGRRSFVRKAGAALSATAAAAFAVSSEQTLNAGDDASTRLTRLEDIHAIRALHESHARELNERDGVVLQKDMHVPDAIEVAPDRRTATARFHCIMHTPVEIGPACTLVEMARLQGGGVVTRTETGVFENHYVREGEGWGVGEIAYRVTG